MAKDLSETVGTALGRIAKDGVKSLSDNARKAPKDGPGSKALAAGAAGIGLIALAPFAGKGVSKLAKGATQKLGGNAKDAVGGKVKDAISGNIKDALPGGKVTGKIAEKVMPGGDGKDKKAHGEGVGKGRRMPVQQDIDIGAPLDTVYKKWIDYEEWPNFMHRLDSVNKDDDEHISFKTKIWGFSKEFKAEITEHKPKKRIKWHVTEGVTHSGVITFHELAPELTRIEVNLDVEPGSLLEKAARGMRHIKRAVRADMARFKAYVLMDEDGEIGRSSTRKRSSSSKRSRSRSSSNGRSSSSKTRASSNGRSSSSKTRASSNGRSSSTSSNGRSRSRSSSRKRAGSRS
jgi:uncharacterized membrane protein